MTFTCGNCGSYDVEITVWMNPNTEQLLGDAGVSWCNHCETADTVTTQEVIDELDAESRSLRPQAIFDEYVASEKAKVDHALDVLRDELSRRG